MSDAVTPAPVETPAQNPEPNPPPPTETAHLLRDLHKEKAERKALEEKLKAKELDDLKKQNQWKEVAEAHAKENEELKGKLSAREVADIERAKYSAIKEAAIRAGIHKTAVSDLKMVDLSGLTVDADLNVTGAEQAVENLKRLRPYWFANTNAPGINLNQPDVISGGGKVSYEDLKKAELEARKTGNYEPYTKLTLAYKQQQAQ